MNRSCRGTFIESTQAESITSNGQSSTMIENQAHVISSSTQIFDAHANPVIDHNATTIVRPFDENDFGDGALVYQNLLIDFQDADVPFVAGSTSSSTTPPDESIISYAGLQLIIASDDPVRHMLNSEYYKAND